MVCAVTNDGVSNGIYHLIRPAGAADDDEGKLMDNGNWVRAQTLQYLEAIEGLSLIAASPTDGGTRSEILVYGYVEFIDA